MTEHHRKTGILGILGFSSGQDDGVLICFVSVCVTIFQCSFAMCFP